METYATTKGQIVIPASLRRKYGIKVGTKIIVSDTGDEIMLRPVTEQYLRKLQGSLKDTNAMEILMEERQKDQARGK
jgi:AbrB family looped-hinge helix DNA binding protein